MTDQLRVLCLLLLLLLLVWNACLLRHDGVSYNKMLAWVDVVMEFIVERLYFLVPALPEILGGLAPNLQVSDSEKRRSFRCYPGYEHNGRMQIKY